MACKLQKSEEESASLGSRADHERRETGDLNSLCSKEPWWH